MDVAQSGPADGRFVVANTYERPSGMANLNNEGFAIAPRAECAGGLKPVFWSDDSNTDSHAVRTGRLSCTDPMTTPGPGTGGGTGGGTGTTPTPPVTRQPQADVTAPVLSSLRASRKRVAFKVSEAARVRITVERRSGKRYKRIKAFTVTSAAGSKTVRFKGRIAAAKLRRGRLRITLMATDAAGNRSKAARRLVGS
jgi:hypothetical protein